MGWVFSDRRGGERNIRGRGELFILVLEWGWLRCKPKVYGSETLKEKSLGEKILPSVENAKRRSMGFFTARKRLAVGGKGGCMLAAEKGVRDYHKTETESGRIQQKGGVGGEALTQTEEREIPTT